MFNVEQKLTQMFLNNFGEDLSNLPAINIVNTEIWICDNPYKELTPPIAGSTLDLSSRFKGPSNCSGGVIRMFLGYSAACRAQDNITLFNYLMGTHLNAAINSAVSKLGPLYKRKIKMFKFDNGSYFKELEMAAGFEFRVIVEHD